MGSFWNVWYRVADLKREFICRQRAVDARAPAGGKVRGNKLVEAISLAEQRIAE